MDTVAGYFPDDASVCARQALLQYLGTIWILIQTSRINGQHSKTTQVMKNKPISDIILGSDNVVEHFSKVFPEVCGLTTRGASRYDIRKFFGFFDPFPPCPHLELIYTIKFTQPLTPSSHPEGYSQWIVSMNWLMPLAFLHEKHRERGSFPTAVGTVELPQVQIRL